MKKKNYMGNIEWMKIEESMTLLNLVSNIIIV